MAKPDLHLCVDRVVSLNTKHLAAEMAFKENPKNKPKALGLMPGASMHPAKIALLAGKKWQNGRTLNVAFLDGSKTQKAGVIKHAQSWSKYANIKLNFNGGSKSEIRVSFQADPGSWSAVGTDCLSKADFPLDEPTMNFGWLDDGTDNTEYRRVVVHEFGHALGAIHEHQNPKGGIKWNESAVYAYFGGPPNNWTKQEIYYNVIMKYSVNQLNGTKFDRKSIMLYSFPKELTLGGTSMPNNTTLSTADKSFIGKMYPKKKK